MGDGRPQPNNSDPQPDEAVWNAGSRSRGTASLKTHTIITLHKGAKWAINSTLEICRFQQLMTA
jgi:hypothetical protein